MRAGESEAGPAAGHISADRQKALSDALHLLVRTDRFAEEVRSRLAAAGSSPEDVEFVVQFLMERKLLNDEKTTRNLIGRSSGKRSVGIERLRADLVRLGAPEEMVEQAVLELLPAEAERALDALKAKFRSGADRGKAGRFLTARGFDEEAVESALDRFCGQIDFPE